MFTFGKRLLLFFLLFVAGLAVAGVAAYAVASAVGNPTAAIRIGAVLQDIFCFVLPPVVLALLVSRLPAEFLQVNRFGGKTWRNAALAIVAVACAVPVINTVTEWNEAINFGALDPWLRQSEESAAAATQLMLGGGSVADLVLGIMVVGVLAGFSEELFFRGGLQRLLLTRPMNPHAAIWLTAAVFSAVHMQFFGFFPRLLLGAMFGYVAWWGGSVWPAMVAHIFNNSLAVTFFWLQTREVLPEGSDRFGAGSALWFVAGLACCALALYGINRNSCAGK